MKKYLLLAALLALARPVSAQKAGDFGAGVVLGNPTGVTGKLWLTEHQAFDMGVGFSSRLTIWADYLVHSWTILPQPSQGKLPLYLGVGAQVRTFRDAELGIRAVAGVAYWLPRDPVELFLEVVPVIRVEPHSSVGLDAGVGIRYYFGAKS